MIKNHGSEKDFKDLIVSIDRHDQLFAEWIKRSIWHHNVNRVILIVVICMVGLNFWRIWQVKNAVVSDINISIKNADQIATVKASQDLYRQQYLQYIKDMIDTMNKLQEDNPNIKVPKAPVIKEQLAVGRQIKPSDLERIPQAGPPKPVHSPTPITKTRVVIKYRAPKKPTPKPFKDWFKSTR